MIEKNTLYVGLILFLVASLYLAFSPYAISEAGYADLLSKGAFFGSISINMLKLIAVVSTAVSAALIFLSLKEKNLNSLLVVIVFIFSVYIAKNTVYLQTPGEFFSLSLFALAVYLFSRDGPVRYGSILALFAGLILIQPYISFDFSKALSVGMLLPLAFFPLLINLSRMRISNELVVSVFAVVTAFFSPALSAVLSAYSFAEVIAGNKISKNIFFASLAVFIFYLTISAGFSNYLNAAIISVSIAGFAYLISLLYQSENPEIKSYLLLLLVVISSTYSIINLELYPLQSPSKSDIDAFAQIKEKYQSISLLSDRSSMKYYSGLGGFILQPSSLLSSADPPSKYLLISANELDGSFAGNPKIFRFNGIDKASNQAIFLNLPYYIAVPVSADGSFNGNGRLVGLTQSGAELLGEVPFTKLKPLFRDTPIFDTNNFIVDTSGLANTTISKIISGYELVYSDSDNKIYKVSN